MQQKKNIKLGKNNFYLNFYYLIIYIVFLFPVLADTNNNEEIKFVEIKILDKVSSKTSKITLNLKEKKKFENLVIKSLKCKNSEFDDNPEVTAYLQVEDLTYKQNDKVFIFNGWTFSSSPSVNPFDHPVYDI